VDPAPQPSRARVVPAYADASDVQRAAAGDHDAFERLYRGHVGRVHALARRMTDDDVAEDLTQEVFIRAWEKLPTFRGESRFGTWLHRLAVNHILSRRETLRKREARRVTGEGILDRVVAPLRRASGLALDFERAVVRLPEGARQVFVLYDVEGYGHEEIAEAMGISVGTSKSQLHRARMLLRGHLDR
jgi:RNA polymerase sigma-70 factor, ECF subfamily